MAQHANAAIHITQTIATLEKRHLDTAVPPLLPVWGKLDQICFYHVQALARFWEADQSPGQPVDYAQYMEDLVTGMYGTGMPFVYLILSTGQSIGVYVGLQGPAGAGDLLSTALHGVFPGIELAAKPESNLGSRLKQEPLFAHLGRMTGIPTRKAGQVPMSPAQGSAPPLPKTEQIERLLRGMRGSSWGYLVVGEAVPMATTLAQAQQGFIKLTAAKGLVHVQESKQSQLMKDRSPTEKYSESVSINRDQTNREAEYCVELLEKQMTRLDLGKALGMWQCEVTFFADRPDTLSRVSALLRAIWTGVDSKPDPVRTLVCQGSPNANNMPEMYLTQLNSAELATLCQLPKEECPGYAVRDYARFDTDLGDQALSPRRLISVGKVMDGIHPTGGWLALEQSDFAKHGLICGVTGSGKTNTLFYLLDKLWGRGQGVPFCVIEPAKAEYRHLCNVAGLESLRVYTLGDETVSPLRLNPFEFEVGVHVQTHIDHLKSVFNAAFILYAPMPYVLETCLHEIYQDKGWDLTSSRNRRLPSSASPAEYPVFPTLSDLYTKIDQVTARLGYEERIQMDVQAGLKARVGSLRLGSKGLMLDTPSGVPMHDLLSRPTVLELERMGSDDEKAFVMGLLMIRLYEYRWVEARTGSLSAGLRHVLVIEEAHRLLKNVSTEIGTEEANTKGQAVETFANMLSEIRAYGQGVLIAEQIPIKLTPDAVKNTNLKVMHRIVAQDDRDVMGAAMNLDEAQIRYVTTLRTGQVVAYTEGADRPYLLQVPRFQGVSSGRPVTDQVLAQTAAGWRSVPPYLAPLLARHISAGMRRSEVRDDALNMQTVPGFDATLRRYFLSLLEDPAQAVYGFNAFSQTVRRALPQPQLPAEKRAAATWCLIAAFEALLDDRGRRYGWLYHGVKGMSETLIDVLADVSMRFENQGHVLDALIAQHTPAVEQFQRRYLQLTSKAPKPYFGCDLCLVPCRYRFDLEPVVQDARVKREFVAAIQQTDDDDAMWAALARTAHSTAQEVIDARSPAAQIACRNIALCLVAQMGARLAFSRESQIKMVRSVKTVLGSHQDLEYT